MLGEWLFDIAKHVRLKVHSSLTFSRSNIFEFCGISDFILCLPFWHWVVIGLPRVGPLQHLAFGQQTVT